MQYVCKKMAQSSKTTEYNCTIQKTHAATTNNTNRQRIQGKKGKDSKDAKVFKRSEHPRTSFQGMNREEMESGRDSKQGKNIKKMLFVVIWRM